MDVQLSDIRIDAGTQPRAEIDEELVREYAEAYRGGAKMPPLVVFSQSGIGGYILADGFHRYHALKNLNKKKASCNLRIGSVRDAILWSVGANATHGLRRTNADKRRAVMTLLEDKEWGAWSDREIARTTGVDHTTVGRLRASLVENTSDNGDPEPQTRKYTDKHGNESTMKTEAIGGHEAIDEDDIPDPPDDDAGSGEDSEPATEPEPKEPETKPKAKKEQGPPKDRVGNVLAGQVLRDDFEQIPLTIRKIRVLFRSLREEINEIMNKRAGANFNKTVLNDSLNNIRTGLSDAMIMPHAVCPLCNGKGCKDCYDLGWLTEHRYDALPPDMKKKGGKK